MPKDQTATKQPLRNREQILSSLLPGLMGDNSDAWSQFYELYWVSLLNHVKKVYVNQAGIDPGDIEDKVQETILNFRQGIKRFCLTGEVMSCPLMYLYTIADNVCKTEIQKKRGRLPARSLEQQQEASGWEPAEPCRSEGNARENEDRFGELIQDVAVKKRIVLERRFRDGVALKDIAEELNVNERTISNYLIESRRSLCVKLISKLEVIREEDKMLVREVVEKGTSLEVIASRESVSICDIEQRFHKVVTTALNELLQ